MTRITVQKPYVGKDLDLVKSEITILTDNETIFGWIGYMLCCNGRGEIQCKENLIADPFMCTVDESNLVMQASTSEIYKMNTDICIIPVTDYEDTPILTMDKLRNILSNCVERLDWVGMLILNPTNKDTLFNLTVDNLIELNPYISFHGYEAVKHVLKI